MIKITESVEDHVVNTIFFNSLASTHESTADPISKANSRTRAQPKTSSQKHVRHVLRLLEQQESKFLDKNIHKAEQERTKLAKLDNTSSKQQVAIDQAHKILQQQVTMMQQGCDATDIGQGPNWPGIPQSRGIQDPRKIQEEQRSLKIC